MITVPREFVDDFNFVMSHYGENPDDWRQWCRENLAEAVEKFREYRKWIETKKV